MGSGDSATTSLQIWGAGGTYRERMLKGVAVGVRRPPKKSKDEQRCPLIQMLHWVLRTQR